MRSTRYCERCVRTTYGDFYKTATILRTICSSGVFLCCVFLENCQKIVNLTFPHWKKKNKLRKERMRGRRRRRTKKWEMGEGEEGSLLSLSTWECLDFFYQLLLDYYFDLCSSSAGFISSFLFVRIAQSFSYGWLSVTMCGKVSLIRCENFWSCTQQPCSGDCNIAIPMLYFI